jgi:serine/threonine-protein kinase
LAKILRPDFLSMPQVVDRLRLEGDILDALDHPNVVRLLDRGTTASGQPYLVLERLVGHTVRRELVRRGALPVVEAVDFALQALTGVGAVHRIGIVHRDLKPDNLFLCRSSRGGRALKVLDFGFAKVLEHRGAKPAIAPLVESTTEQGFVGAARFIAPEQLLMGKAVDHRADLYTLGLVLYTLVLGREPHHEIDSRDEILRAQIEGRLPPPSSDTAERVSPKLLAIIWRATNFARTARFASAEEFEAELREFLSDQALAPPAMRILTVQQHAEMTATIEANPDQAEEVRAKYGIRSSADERAVVAWWKRNIVAHPEAHAKWRALVDLYRQRQRSSRRKS